MVKIHSQAPCRVDLAGSTLDIWPLYVFHEGAVTVNFAVDRYTSASILPRNDSGSRRPIGHRSELGRSRAPRPRAERVNRNAG